MTDIVRRAAAGPQAEDETAGEDRPGLLAVPPRPAGQGLTGWLRWAWRVLTSMRTALILLALLALAAVPGSLLPQRGVASDPTAVPQFTRNNPTIAPWLDRLGLFEVYSSPWFAAIYLLLLVSMTGCVLPRAARLWRAVRAAPPPPPPNLARMDGQQQWTTDRGRDAVLADAARELRRRRFRVRVTADAVSAEKGYLREAGNLLFHLSLLLLLFGVAVGSLLGFEGRVIVVEGSGFSNTRALYDEFMPGPLTDTENLTPFSFTLTDFSAAFEPSGPQRGSPRDFRADVEVRRSPGSPDEDVVIQVNRPLDVDGTKVFLTGNGYAPQVTVRDGTGETVFTGPVVFLPLDGNLTSEGVIKVPDAEPTQLGFEGMFLPTAAVDPQRGPYSLYPDTLDPQLFLTAYTGDLGLDGGRPQSVFTLDKSRLDQVTEQGRPFARALRVGETMTLPDGKGSLTFDGVSRFANFQIAYDPGRQASLVAALVLLAGLTASLTVRRRRIWVRVRTVPGTGTVVEAATFGLTRRGTPDGELTTLADTLRSPTSTPDQTAVPGPTE